MKQWEIAADSIPLLICLLNQEGNIVLVNRTAEKWGLGSMSACRGRTLHQILHPKCEEPSCYLYKFEQKAVEEFAHSRRTHCDAFDQILGRHLDIRIQPPIRSLDASGDLFAIATVDDISELKFYEKKMQVLRFVHQQRIAGEVAKRMEAEEIKNRLVTILEKTPASIAMAGADGALLYLNPAGRALLGLEPNHDLSDLTLLDSHAPEVRQTLAGEAMHAARHCGVWSGDSTLLSRSGQEIPTSLVMIAHHDQEGRVSGYSAVEQDMTEWVSAENALRHSQNELRRLSEELLTVQETERQRISIDLHDGLGQSLSLIKLSLEDASRLMADGAQSEAEQTLQRLIPKVKDTIAEVRRISMDLRPSTLDDLGLLPTLSWFFREFEEHCKAIRVEKDFTVQEWEIPKSSRITMFRIIQEATNNIVKHADATLIRIGLARDGDLVKLTIEDDGKGFDPAERRMAQPTPEGGGLGLRGMKERARLVGGIMLVESEPGEGTRINIWWPAGELEDPFEP